MNVKAIRRENLRQLAQQVGGVTALARYLGKSQSQISHLIGANPIKNVGDRLAQYIEQSFQKPEGWLDRDQTENETSQLANMQFPLISWSDSAHWLQHRNIIKPHEQIISAVCAGSNSFALTLSDYSQVGNSIHFPKAATAIIDPDAEYSNEDYVLVHTPGSSEPSIKHLAQGGVGSSDVVIGRVMQFIVNL